MSNLPINPDPSINALEQYDSEKGHRLYITKTGDLAVAKDLTDKIFHVFMRSSRIEKQVDTIKKGLLATVFQESLSSPDKDYSLQRIERISALILNGVLPQFSLDPESEGIAFSPLMWDKTMKMLGEGTLKISPQALQKMERDLEEESPDEVRLGEQKEAIKKEVKEMVEDYRLAKQELTVMQAKGPEYYSLKGELLYKRVLEYGLTSSARKNIMTKDKDIVHASELRRLCEEIAKVDNPEQERELKKQITDVILNIQGRGFFGSSPEEAGSAYERAKMAVIGDMGFASARMLKKLAPGVPYKAAIMQLIEIDKELAQTEKRKLGGLLLFTKIQEEVFADVEEGENKEKEEALRTLCFKYCAAWSAETRNKIRQQITALVGESFDQLSGPFNTIDRIFKLEPRMLPHLDIKIEEEIVEEPKDAKGVLFSKIQEKMQDKVALERVNGITSEKDKALLNLCETYFINRSRVARDQAIKRIMHEAPGSLKGLEGFLNELDRQYPVRDTSRKEISQDIELYNQQGRDTAKLLFDKIQKNLQVQELAREEKLQELCARYCESQGNKERAQLRKDIATLANIEGLKPLFQEVDKLLGIVPEVLPEPLKLPNKEVLYSMIQDKIIEKFEREEEVRAEALSPEDIEAEKESRQMREEMLQNLCELYCNARTPEGRVHLKADIAGIARIRSEDLEDQFRAINRLLGVDIPPEEESELPLQNSEDMFERIQEKIDAKISLEKRARPQEQFTQESLAAEAMRQGQNTIKLQDLCTQYFKPLPEEERSRLRAEITGLANVEGVDEIFEKIDKVLRNLEEL